MAEFYKGNNRKMMTHDSFSTSHEEILYMEKLLATPNPVSYVGETKPKVSAAGKNQLLTVNFSLLTALSLVFCLLFGGKAFAETATIGTGTSTGHYPIPGYFGWQYDVYLYTPSDASFLSSACTISSIAWNISSNSTSTAGQFTIWVKDVDASYSLSTSTTFSSYTSGATQVYNSSSYSSSSGWNTYNFSSSFSHQAGKALLVAVRGVGCSTSGGCSRYCYYTSATSTHWYKHADSSDPGTSVSGTIDDSRSNVQITYTAVTSHTINGTIQCGGTVSGTLGTTGSTWGTGSSPYNMNTSWGVGAEAVYAFTPQMTGTHTIAFNTTSGDPDFWVLSDNNPQTAIYATGGGNQTAELTAGHTYYLVADNYSSSNSAGYSITVTCPEPPVTVEVGSSGSTNSYIPTGIYYNYSLSQQIYKASEIGHTGTISKLSYYHNGSATTRTLVIYMKMTSNNILSSYDSSPGTTVYSGSVTFAANGWTTITLNTPFNYSNICQNLMITVDDNTGSYVNGHTFATYSTGENRAMYGNSDGTNYTPTSSNSLSVTSYNNYIKLYMTNPTTYKILTLNYDSSMGSVSASPSGTSCTNNRAYPAGTTVTLTASANSGYSFVNWTVDGNTVTDNPTTVTMNANHTVTANFTDAPATVPYTETFESSTWPMANGSRTNKWYRGAAGARNGSYGLFISNDGSNNTYDIAAEGAVWVYKTINFSETADYAISFDWRAYAESCCDYIRVGLVPASTTLTDGSDFSTPSGWIDLNGGSGLNYQTAWQRKTVIQNVTAGTYKLAFCWRNDGSVGTDPPAAIDNIEVRKALTVAVSAGTGGSASGGGSFALNQRCVVTATPNSGYCFLNWTEGGTAVSTNPTYAFDVSANRTLVANFSSLDANSISVAGNSVSCGNAATLTVSGLSGVTYNWYSDAACTDLVATGTTLTTPALYDNTTYYVKAVKESVREQYATFSYTGSQQSYSIPSGASALKMEVWGAQGGGRQVDGNTNGGWGGNGGYSVGTLTNLSGVSSIYVYVGGQGQTSMRQSTTAAPGGWNGGGTAFGSSSGDPGCGGGGATDIRVNNNTLYYRIMVAGGGGGGGEDSEQGGYGGGTTGGTGSSSSTTGGTQTGGGTGYAFGIGASTQLDGGAGGGGWYGGGCGSGSQTIPTSNSTDDSQGGCGGSGYVWTSSTASSAPSGYGVSSSYYLSDAQTIGGNSTMPNPFGGTMTGNQGNGYARITAIYNDVCESDVKTVNVTVSRPSANDISVSGTTTISCGSNTTLTASGLDGVTYNWYSDQACTQLVQANSATLNTPALNDNTTYYVKAVKESQSEGTATTFEYTGSVQSYAIPSGASSVKLEVWGAQGGDATYGGKGGYSVGMLNNLSGISNLYVYVGQQPSGTTEGWNGGGRYSNYGSSGGGATDISLHNNTYNTTNHYNDRIIVAGGGGGKGYSSTYGGAGGGLNGVTGGVGSATSGGAGASQTSGGIGASNTSSHSGSSYSGEFGKGAAADYGGGGGGGWYGGGSGINSGTDAGGGGGSGYVWTSSTASSAPTGYSVSSSYYLTDAQTIAGNTSFPAPGGGTETGHSGNGYARITPYYSGSCESDAKAVTVTVNPLTLSGSWPSNITGQNNCFANKDISGLYSDAAVKALYTDCSGLTVTHTDANTETSNCGWTVTRTYTITDDCNHSETRTMSVSGSDQTAPVLSGSWPANITNQNNCLANRDISGLLSDAQAAAKYTDACGGTVTATHEDAVTGNNCSWTVTRTYTIKDACNNSTTKTMSVSGGDKTAPALSGTWPSNITNQNNCLANRDISGLLSDAQAAAKYTDACGGTVTATHEDAVTGNNCGWTVTRTYTIKDACNNSTTKTMSVSGSDQSAPVLSGSWPSNITGQNNCYANRDISELLSDAAAKALYTDCSGLTVTHEDANTPTSNCGWTVTRTYTITDGCSHSTTATMSVSGSDQTAPALSGTWPSNITGQNNCLADRDISALLSDAAAAAKYEDACGGTVTATHEDAITGDNCGWTVTRTYTIKDACNNTTTATQSVSGSDQTAPVIGDVEVPAAIALGSCSYKIPDLSSATLAASADGCGYAVTWVSQSVAANTEYAQTSVAQNISVTVKVKDECNNEATKVVNVVIPANDLSVSAGDDNVICFGETQRLTGEASSSAGGLTYSWTSAASEAGLPGTTNVANIDVTPTSVGDKTYRLTVVDGNGCSAYDDVLVTVNPLPTPTLVTDHTPLCLGDEATLTAGGGTTYYWYDGSDFVETNTHTVSPTSNTEYSVTVKNSHGCTASMTVTQTVQQAPGNTPMTHVVQGHIWTGRVSSDWDDSRNWLVFTGGGSGYTIAANAPTSSDPVVVRTGATCINNEPSVNANSTANNVIIRDGRTLTVEGSRTLAVNGDIDIESGGALAFSGSGTVSVTGDANIASGATVTFGNKDTLNVAGNLVLTGSLEFPTSDTTPALRIGGNLTLNNGSSLGEGGTLLFAGNGTTVTNNNPGTFTVNNNVRLNMHRSRAGVPHTVFPDGTIFSKTTIFEYGIMDGNVTFNETGRAIVCGDYESYASGTVTKIGAGNNFTFPTGDDNVLGSVTARIDPDNTVHAKFHHWSGDNGDGSHGFTTDVIPRWWNAADMCGGDPFNHVSNFEYWDISSPVELSNVMLMANAATGTEHFNTTSAYVDADIQVAAYSNGCWSNFGGSAEISGADHNVITINGANIPKDPHRAVADFLITLGSKTDNTVLPIELVSFTATCDGRSSLVEWTTATEKNNDYFSLERSDDAINFTEIARVAGAGNSIEPLDYSYTDYGIHGGDNYYRLVQVDYDGTRTVSEIVVANCIEPEVGEPDVQAYPNPFNDELTVVLDNFSNRAATIEVYDMLGKLIYTDKIAAPQNSYETVLNLSNLPPAAYTVRVSTTDFVINRNVVKQ